MTVIIRAIHSESFSEELKAEQKIPESNKPQTVKKSSKLCRPDPFVDDSGVLRVGCRLRHATLEFGEKQPILMPKKNSVADLITQSLPQTSPPPRSSDYARCHPPSWVPVD